MTTDTRAVLGTATGRDLEFEDGRSDLPIFIHSELDDLPLSLEAFRVYAHLSRRAGKKNLAWPSYHSMGEACFRKSYPKASRETLRRKAIAAVNELIEAGLIGKVVTCNDRGEYATNRYRLTPRCEWRYGSACSQEGGSVNALGSGNTLGSVNAPKGSPIEDTPYEDAPEKEGREAASPPSVLPSSLPEDAFKPLVQEKETGTNQTARAPSPPVAAAPPAPPVEVAPHVAAYQDILERPLSPAQREEILSAAPLLADWLVALRVWKGEDYNPLHVDSILELAADPKRARWKLAQLEKIEEAPQSYQVDIDEAQALPYVPDTPPVEDVTWPVATPDPLTTGWGYALAGELPHIVQLAGSTIRRQEDRDGQPVFVVQVGKKEDADWLKVQAMRSIKVAVLGAAQLPPKTAIILEVSA